MELTGLTTQKLRQAADLQEKIEMLQAQLARLLSGGETFKAAVAVRSGRGGPRNISAAGRARIAAAARARWAKFNQEKAATGNGQAPKKTGKRRLSAAGRAAIAAAAKARWARERAQKS